MKEKNDYYTLKFFREKICIHPSELNLMPGGGSGSLDDMIRLYLTWGRKFILLLDSDQAGANQKARYKELFGILVEGCIFSLEDINPDWQNQGMGFLIEEEDRRAIQSSIYPSLRKYKKTQFNRALQELYINDTMVNVSAVTVEKFKQIIEFCERALAL